MTGENDNQEDGLKSRLLVDIQDGAYRLDQKAGDVLAYTVRSPKCKGCDRHFFDSSYTKVGNLIASTTGKGAILLGAGYALAPALAPQEAAVQFAAKMAELAERDELASDIRDFSAADLATKKFTSHLDEKWEEVQWGEDNGDPVCYQYPDCRDRQ